MGPGAKRPLNGDLLDELRRVRDAARCEEAAPRQLPPYSARSPFHAPPGAGLEPTLPEALPAPRSEPLNSLWRTDEARRGWLGRLLGWFWRGSFSKQEAFNSAQVQFDNALLAFLESRFALTHGHYDRLFGEVGRHGEEADARHLMLQEELVRHVHDLVQRIDLVLVTCEKNRLAQEQSLRELRERLAELEQRMPPG